MATTPERAGASRAAIRAHYDVGNEFYRLWLDQTMSYSSAMWRNAEDRAPLHEAQQRKIEWHLHHSGADRASDILDIGCGWGGMLRAAVQDRGFRSPAIERAVGLTLSNAQAALAQQLAAEAGATAIEIRVESWADHRPLAPYGALISVGAFEHFTKPADGSEAKVAIYRSFFEKCRELLTPEGCMTLQTIAYGDPDDMTPTGSLIHDIFPDSELPRLPEIIAAANGLFEIERLRNDRADYGRTCELWAATLKGRRAEAEALVGREQTRRYERYLKFAAWGFWSHRLHLLRLRMKRR